MTETPADRPPRRRKPPRPVEVVSVSRLAPRLVSVLVRGDALDGFRIEAPTAHVKVNEPEGQLLGLAFYPAADHAKQLSGEGSNRGLVVP